MLAQRDRRTLTTYLGYLNFKADLDPLETLPARTSQPRDFITSMPLSLAPLSPFRFRSFNGVASDPTRMMGTLRHLKKGRMVCDGRRHEKYPRRPDYQVRLFVSSLPNSASPTTSGLLSLSPGAKSVLSTPKCSMHMGQTRTVAPLSINPVKTFVSVRRRPPYKAMRT